MSTDPDEVQDQVDDVEDPGGSTMYSYAYLTGLFTLIAVGLVASVYFGFVTPDVEVTASLSIGWILEYAVAGIVVIFFFWTFAQVANIVGMGFISGVVGVVARIADNYQMPNPPGDGDESAEDDDTE